MEAYDNAGLYKERTKYLHDKLLHRKQFFIGQKLLLFNSRLKFLPGKLRSRWIGPFVALNIFLNGVIEIQSIGTNEILKVSGHRLKPFINFFERTNVEEIQLVDPIYKET